jgi:hypothetical protein
MVDGSPYDGLDTHPAGELSVQEAHERAADPDGFLVGKRLEEPTPRLTAEEAARRAVDPDYLMPGERRDIVSSRAADAIHWTSVYGELMTFKEELLSLSRSRIETMSGDAGSDARIDEVILEHQAERYRRRIAFWKARLRELGVAERDGHA